MTTKLIDNASSATLQVNGQDALVFNKNGLITTPITTRQTVELGTVDSSGFSAFGGSTGSTTVTTATTLYLNAANGMVNRRGSITNPSWTGLSTNGTMYLYLDIGADGTCTSGSGTLAPVYQHGGTYSTTANQFTFNTQEMQGKVGNGSTAAQTYRVYVGEVVVSANVVASIIWYALNGRYDSGYTATLPTLSTTTTRNHNIGIKPQTVGIKILCTTTDIGYSVGDELTNTYTGDSGSVSFTPRCSTLTCRFITSSGTAWVAQNATTGSGNALTLANWSYKLIAGRGW